MNPRPSKCESDALPLSYIPWQKWFIQIEPFSNLKIDWIQFFTFDSIQNGNYMMQKVVLAERSFDLRTSGLWAQHASTAPLCFMLNLHYILISNVIVIFFNNRETAKKKLIMFAVLQ